MALCFRIFQNVTLLADDFIFFGQGNIGGREREAWECRSKHSSDCARLVQSTWKGENLKRMVIEANAIPRPSRAPDLREKTFRAASLPSPNRLHGHSRRATDDVPFGAYRYGNEQHAPPHPPKAEKWHHQACGPTELSCPA